MIDAPTQAKRYQKTGLPSDKQGSGRGQNDDWIKFSGYVTE